MARLFYIGLILVAGGGGRILNDAYPAFAYEIGVAHGALVALASLGLARTFSRKSEG